jgi:hypothetical protein
MIRRNITLPELGLIAGTRAALGVGVGLLVSGRMSRAQRRAVGWTLLGVGVVTTFPLLAQVIYGESPAGPERRGARPTPEPAGV